MVLCDLPYGTTSCKWDVTIPFEPLWKQYKRIIKGNGAIVLFGTEPFASALRLSCPELYKYDWYWKKSLASGFVNAKLKPMNCMETISVFSFGATANGSNRNMPYYPQGLTPCNLVKKRKLKHKKENTYQRKNSAENNEGHIQTFTGYPSNFLEFSNGNNSTVHPTQKPVDLLEYLICTYTNEGEIVLDNCAGSGSTAIAAINSNRNFIGFELDVTYYNLAKERINKHIIDSNMQDTYTLLA